MEKYLAIASKFEIDGTITEIKPLGPGFINDTFIVKTQEGPKFILQRKNHVVFPDVPGMMNNIIMVTEHIKAKVAAAGGDPMREVLTVTKRAVETLTGEEKAQPYCDLYYKDEDGNFWAVCIFIEGSITYEKADNPKLAFNGGQGIGKFQSQLADFTEPLAEVIKGFHNIKHRFVQWDEAIAQDAAGRVASLSEEISWIESRREEMLAFWAKVESDGFGVNVKPEDPTPRFDELRAELDRMQSKMWGVSVRRGSCRRCRRRGSCRRRDVRRPFPGIRPGVDPSNNSSILPQRSLRFR